MPSRITATTETPDAEPRERVYSYRALLREVEITAAMLQSLGVSRGDRVLLYMPMIPEAVFAMLACARIGAVHSVVFGGFAAHELAARIDHARPVLVLSASSILVASSGAAKPPNTTECTAPMRAQASMAITASGTIGM